MKYFNFVTILCITSFISLTSAIRFGTYNIRSGCNIDYVCNLTVTAETIKELGVDIIALQEVDNLTRRNPIDQTAYIAQYNKVQPFEFFYFEKTRNFQNGSVGISILSKQTTIKRVLTYHYYNTIPEQCPNRKYDDYCQGLTVIEIPYQYPNIKNLQEYPEVTQVRGRKPKFSKLFRKFWKNSSKNNKNYRSLMHGAYPKSFYREVVTNLSIYFGTTHLGIGINGSEQFNEAKQIVRWMTDNIIKVSRNPYIILMTGDYGSILSDSTIKNVMGSLFVDLWTENDICKQIVDLTNINGYTFNSSHPSIRYDYFFMYKSPNFPQDIKFNCEIQVVSTLSSDHRPVILDFDFL